MKHLGFNETARKNAKILMSNRQQKTVVNNTESDWNPFYQGLPQDVILGPLFFSLYLIDLSQLLTDKSRVVQYADETLLFCNES